MVGQSLTQPLVEFRMAFLINSRTSRVVKCYAFLKVMAVQFLNLASDVASLSQEPFSSELSFSFFKAN